MAGYMWSVQSLATALFAAILTVLLVISLGADRREKQRVAGELEAARVVQQYLLPKSDAATASFGSDAVYEPAQEVGGDFYWTRVDPHGSLLVALGDVSGKGLKAALLVSVAIGILRTVRSQSSGVILATLNDGLAGHTGGGFVTCCCARFDTDGTVTIADAGHPSPYWDGREVEVEAGLPLGVAAGVEYVATVRGGGSRLCPMAWWRLRTRRANCSGSSGPGRLVHGRRLRSRKRLGCGARTTTSRWLPSGEPNEQLRVPAPWSVGGSGGRLLPPEAARSACPSAAPGQ